jgi:hypothetical protein
MELSPSADFRKDGALKTYLLFYPKLQDQWILRSDMFLFFLSVSVIDVMHLRWKCLPLKNVSFRTELLRHFCHSEKLWNDNETIRKNASEHLLMQSIHFHAHLHEFKLRTYWWSCTCIPILGPIYIYFYKIFCLVWMAKFYIIKKNNDP